MHSLFTRPAPIVKVAFVIFRQDYARAPLENGGMPFVNCISKYTTPGIRRGPWELNQG